MSIHYLHGLDPDHVPIAQEQLTAAKAAIEDSFQDPSKNLETSVIIFPFWESFILQSIDMAFQENDDTRVKRIKKIGVSKPPAYHFQPFWAHVMEMVIKNR